METYYIYLRKSRADKELETIAEILERHENILQAYAMEKLGETIPEKNIYREIVSGETIQDRPVLRCLLEKIQEGSCTAVLVIEPQRLSRGDLQDCGTIIRAFQYTNTLIITPQKTYNLSDKFDRKFFEMELVQGNDYLEYVKEIMLRGRIASVSQGNFIASIPPYGYKKIKNGKSYTLAENEESDIVRLIFDLYVNQHMSIAKICQYLDNLGIKPRKKAYWVQASIKDILQNPVYIGKIRWNWRKTVKTYENGQIIKSRPKTPKESWILTDGKHPALISEKIFFAAQENFGNTPKLKKKTELVNPFAGLCRCECGCAMVTKPSKNARLRIMCQQQTHCHNKSALYEEFEQAVVDQLQKCINEINFEKENQKNDTMLVQPHVIKNLKKEKLELEKQQDKLYELLEKGIYSEFVFVQRNAALDERRKQLEQAISIAQENQKKKISYDEKIFLLSESISCIQNQELLPSVKNCFLKTVIKSITYSRKMDRYDKSPFTLEVSLHV